MGDATTNRSASGATAVLTHYGRKSGKPYRVTVWFVQIDDAIWVGSLDACRAWVRNLEAYGRAVIDLGDGPIAVRCERCDAGPSFERFTAAIRSKYPVRSRLLAYFVKGRRCAFRLTPELEPKQAPER